MISHWEGGRKFPAGRGEGKVEGRGRGKGGGRSRHREKEWSSGGTGSGGDDGAECRVGSFGSGAGGSSGLLSCLGEGGDLNEEIHLANLRRGGRGGGLGRCRERGIGSCTRGASQGGPNVQSQKHRRWQWSQG